ncbi:spore germination lipoprotein GerD [Metabacillus fastidiosus]|uniref:spore germination lipoprotein GerD n=1 Tax=Metabacillus fastidiosus TaxID=1458 RepID=UPI002DBD8CAD|nr:spore germination lipoprotein GerD [Metabacillus fastidiosus]MEC2075472.1 spore germination lipoprotein GerD [Metabacillus fastidiosus]
MKKKMLLMISSIYLLSIILYGCAPQESSGGQTDYDQTKKMVVDILKTDDGKKALQEIMKDEKLKHELVMDQKVVTETIQATLTSEKGKEFWKTLFEDPKFVESYAKSMKEEHEKVIKDLMKDPEYQAMLIELFQNPEMEKATLTVLKSKDFRKHLQEVITETLTSPLFKAKIQETLLKAAEETGQQSSGGSQSGSGQSGGQEKGS